MKTDNDHLTAPMLSAAMDQVIFMRARIAALEAALCEILKACDTGPTGTPWMDNLQQIARAALDKDARFANQSEMPKYEYQQDDARSCSTTASAALDKDADALVRAALNRAEKRAPIQKVTWVENDDDD